MDKLPGPVKVYSVHKLLAPSSYVQSLGSYPGPLSSSSPDKVARYITEKLASNIEESNDPESLQLLWKLVKIYLDHYGNIAGAENAAAQKAIKDMLLETEWGAYTQSLVTPTNRGVQEEQH